MGNEFRDFKFCEKICVRVFIRGRPFPGMGEYTPHHLFYALMLILASKGAKRP
jgi:hypothetical protein